MGLFYNYAIGLCNEFCTGHEANFHYSCSTEALELSLSYIANHFQFLFKTKFKIEINNYTSKIL